MMLRTINAALAVSAGLSLSAAWGQGHAAQPQSYPNRPLRFIVPFSPGGSNDMIAHSLAAKLADDLGQPVVVDNRGGANGIIGAGLTARSLPDGHTFVIVGNSFAINAKLYRKLPYDAERDFAPVSLVGQVGFMLVVHPSLPAREVKGLIALAKASPGELTMATAGIGNVAHLAGELFMSMTGTRFLNVPYKGGGPAMNELLGGHVLLYFSTSPVALPHVRTGKLRALAVTGSQRASVTPELPTIAEAGVPGYSVDGWYGILMPARTPPAIVSRFAGSLQRALQSPEVKQKFGSLGIDASASSPEELRKTLVAEIAKWGKVIGDAGIQPE